MPSIREQVQEMLHGRYRDDAVEEAVFNDAEKAGTLERIADGELALPGRQDAIHWHERITGVKQPTANEAAQADIIKGMSERIAALEAHLNPPEIPPDFQAAKQLAETPHQQSEVR